MLMLFKSTTLRRQLSLIVLTLIAQCYPPLWAASTLPTATSLQIPSAPVADGNVCVLLARVTGNGSPISVGTVVFREGSMDLGTAPLRADGTASLEVALPPGKFLVRARFNGSNAGLPSVSPPSTLLVKGTSQTTLVTSGQGGQYTLTAAVTGDQAINPSGTVTFTDQTSGQTIGTASLVPGTIQSTVTSMNLSTLQTETTLAGDWNGDGRTDYVVQGTAANGQSAPLQVSFANGAGGFVTVTAQLFPGSNAKYVIEAVGDFNRDGKDDLLIAYNEQRAGDFANVAVFLSDGGGGFARGTPSTGVFSNLGVFPGDFNGDGKLDVLQNVDTGSTYDTVLINGDGEGNLGVPQSLNIGNIQPIVVTDFNHDGSLDFVGRDIGIYGDGRLYVYLGDGNQLFTQSDLTVFGQAPFNIPPRLGEFNGDGIPDLVAYETFNPPDSGVDTRLGVGNGTFHEAPGTYITDMGPHIEGNIFPMDVNGDGNMDIAVLVADTFPTDGSSPKFNLQVLYGDGTGHFRVSRESSPDASGNSYSSPATPFTFPVIGKTLFASTRPIATATATITGVNPVGLGTHSVIATYSGNGVLPASASNPVPLSGNIDFSQGFTSASLDENGSAKVVGSVIRLTDGGQNEAGSAFYPTPLNVQAFTTDFDFLLTNPKADGFTFTIQNNSPHALGGKGGTLGYAGIPRSMAIKFDLFDNAGEGPDSTGIYTGGATPTVPSQDLTLGVDLHRGVVFHAHMLYDGARLQVTITDTTTGQSAGQSYTIAIPQAVGATTAWVGFTGATGGLTATQDILNWSYSPLPYFPQFVAQGMTLNGGAVVRGNRLHLIDSGVANEARSAYFLTPVDVRNFKADFTFQASNAIADGFAFVLQNAGPNAIGPSGSGLGYGGSTGGIPRSVAVKFDLYNNAGEGTDSTGLYVGGASPTIPFVDMTQSGVKLRSDHVMRAIIGYDGIILAMTVIDTVTNARSSQRFQVDLPAEVGGTTALVGFTASTGALSAQEDVLSWTYVPVD